MVAVAAVGRTSDRGAFPPLCPMHSRPTGYCPPTTPTYCALSALSRQCRRLRIGPASPPPHGCRAPAWPAAGPRAPPCPPLRGRPRPPPPHGGWPTFIKHERRRLKFPDII